MCHLRQSVGYTSCRSLKQGAENYCYRVAHVYSCGHAYPQVCIFTNKSFHLFFVLIVEITFFPKARWRGMFLFHFILLPTMSAKRELWIDPLPETQLQIQHHPSRILPVLQANLPTTVRSYLCLPLENLLTIILGGHSQNNLVCLSSAHSEHFWRRV
jgi:hypothetical protein